MGEQQPAGRPDPVVPGKADAGPVCGRGEPEERAQRYEEPGGDGAQDAEGAAFPVREPEAADQGRQEVAREHARR